MSGTLFNVFGILLVVSALAVAVVGLRFQAFPGSRIVLLAVVAYFACLVGATTTFAVLHAADDQAAREAEEAQQAQATTPTTTTSTTGGGAPQAAASTLKLSADPSAIAFNTTKLSAKAGQVTIDFNNPSALTHDVCVEGTSGEIGCSDTISQSSTSLSETLKPGKYTFYCSVDGHRQAGMEGTLTVQ